jgi:hypothetical protein
MKPNWSELFDLYMNGAELCELSREATDDPKRPKHGTLRNRASREKWSSKRELLRAEKRILSRSNDEELQQDKICPPSPSIEDSNRNSLGLVSTDCPDSDYWQHGRNWRRL